MTSWKSWNYFSSFAMIKKYRSSPENKITYTFKMSTASLNKPIIWLEGSFIRVSSVWVPISLNSMNLHGLLSIWVCLKVSQSSLKLYFEIFDILQRCFSEEQQVLRDDFTREMIYSCMLCTSMLRQDGTRRYDEIDEKSPAHFENRVDKIEILTTIYTFL